MPIIELQRRLREIGRIRIGEQVPTENGKTRPVKLEQFRFTSRDQRVIDAAAAAYGGTVEPWASPDGQQWQVKSTANDITVVVPPGEMSFSQFYETWSAGGCQRRCDGQTEYIGDRSCVCDPDNRECAIHTRLSVILPDLPGLGVWRLETSGYYAAVELGGVVEIAAAYWGQMLPARLRLEQRSVKRPGKNGKPETRRFAVPTLDLDVNPMQLASGNLEQPAIGNGAPPSAQFQPVPVAELPVAPVASISEQAAAVNEPAAPSTRRNAAAPIPSTGLRPRTAAEAESGTASSERVCTRCSQPLGGAVVERDGDGYAHKGDCPGSAAPAPAPDGEPKLSRTDRARISKLATDAFPCAFAPKGKVTETRRRLRHAITLAATGERWHLDDLLLTDVTPVAARLEAVIAGTLTASIDDEGVTFFDSLNAQEIEVRWSQIADPEPEPVG